MTETVTKVEQGANARAFLGIGHDETRLGVQAMRDRMLAGVSLTVHDRRAVAFAPQEEFGIVDQSVFRDLRISRDALATIERVDQ